MKGYKYRFHCKFLTYLLRSHPLEGEEEGEVLIPVLEEEEEEEGEEGAVEHQVQEVEAEGVGELDQVLEGEEGLLLSVVFLPPGHQVIQVYLNQVVMVLWKDQALHCRLNKDKT